MCHDAQCSDASSMAGHRPRIASHRVCSHLVEDLLEEAVDEEDHDDGGDERQQINGRGVVAGRGGERSRVAEDEPRDDRHGRTRAVALRVPVRSPRRDRRAAATQPEHGHRDHEQERQLQQRVRRFAAARRSERHGEQHGRSEEGDGFCGARGCTGGAPRQPGVRRTGRMPTNAGIHRNHIGTVSSWSAEYLTSVLPVRTNHSADPAITASPATRTAAACLMQAPTDGGLTELRRASWAGERHVCRVAAAYCTGAPAPDTIGDELADDRLEQQAERLHVFVDSLTLQAVAYRHQLAPARLRATLRAELEHMFPPRREASGQPP